MQNDIELKVFKEFVQKTLNIDEDYYVPSDILNNDNVEETFLIFKYLISKKSVSHTITR